MPQLKAKLKATTFFSEKLLWKICVLANRHTNIATGLAVFACPPTYLLVTLLAYCFRDVFTLELVLYGPALLAIIPVLLMKESTRWLIAKGRLQEAKENIIYIAKMNGKVRIAFGKLPPK